ncbi:MAG: DNA polymerase III subunit gamma/tau [Candidatus Omnitrophica bacterium]|nr:DNA polymerase III subunit gamma/tau [Candidatus Omnitrophota bacterium]
MGYQVLALKYRPKTFSEVRGQEQITTALTKGLAEKRIANAYLFSGPRGVGKTSVARILARSLNCVNGPIPEPCNECENCREIMEGRSLDFLEVDGASNRGIDEIRAINENTRFMPIKNRYKVYLIDEVHMLTDFAFNAILKTLEEPPEHAKFIFATTHPDKLPPTIISRCQRFDFHLITTGEISRHLAEIAGMEKVRIEPAALLRISQSAAGSFRDGLGILDQLTSFRFNEQITVDDVEQLLSLVPEKVYLETIQLLRSGNRRGCLEIVARVSASGYDLFQFASGVLEFVRYLVLIKAGAGDLATDAITPESVHTLTGLAAQFTMPELLNMLEKLANERDKLKHEDLLRVRLETIFLKLAEIFGTPQKVESVLREKPEYAPLKEKVIPEPIALKPEPLAKKPVLEEAKPDMVRESVKTEKETKEEFTGETTAIDLWRLFLEEVGKEKPFLLPTLKAGRLKKIGTGPNGKTVHLCFQRQFEQGLLKSNQAILTEIWSRKFASGSVLFETVIEEGEKISEITDRPQAIVPRNGPLNVRTHSLKSEAAEPAHHASASLVPEEEELVRRVLGMFDGEVTSVKKET